VLVYARYLVDRLRLPRARADSVREVRRRLEEQRGACAVGHEEVRLARELRRLREELSVAFGSLESCRSCARPPSRLWPGGHCCGGRAESLFTDDELAALKLSGTTPGRLRPPRADLAGCPFREPAGCSLAPADRPSVCVRYVCLSLERELRQRGDRQAIAALQTELAVAFRRFVALRAARIERETFPQ